MAIAQLYKSYFQKSRNFLYPVLGIKKGSYTNPLKTFISWENKIKPTDKKLICVYAADSRGFATFERDILFQNHLFSDVVSADQGRKVFVFDFKPFSDDWKMFLEGKYSKLSLPVKQAVRNYYGAMSPEYAYMESFMYPEKYLNIYTELLYDKKDFEEGYELLKNVGELCPRFDAEKEMLKIPVLNLENSGQMS
jgi:hypothetical protein